ncbi:MAG TPA: VanZ family protein [bacterium]|nr:VanZ family protein [bacterium]
MKISNRARIITVFAYMAVIFILSSMPGDKLAGRKLPVSDKLLHAGEYLLFGTLIAWAIIKDTASPVSLRKIGLVLAIGCGYALLDEFHQYFVPNRDMEFFDFAADTVGIILGTGLYVLIIRQWISKQPNVS